jgi:E3 ubiquitin-protein ligase HERC3
LAKGVAADEFYSCAVMQDGRVKCWGRADVLGVQATSPGVGDEPGEMGSDLKPLVQPDERAFARIVAGNRAACGIRDDKTVYCWGGNSVRGALTPQYNLNLGNPSTVLEVSVGSGHACAVLTNNALKCWGANDEGQLGQGDYVPRYDSSDMGDALSPVQLGVGKTAKSVATGPSWVCAVVSDGSVKCWGRNVIGELGKGDKVSVGGSVGDMNTLQPLDLAGRKAKQLAIAGDVTTCALIEDGTIRCWGTVNTPNKVYLGDQPGEMGANLPLVTLKF